MYGILLLRNPFNIESFSEMNGQFAIPFGGVLKTHLSSLQDFVHLPGPLISHEISVLMAHW